MAVAPVVIGAAAALAQPYAFGWFAEAPLTGETYAPGAVSVGWWQAAVAVLALMVALALQVGVNYANDYSDGVRGTDDARVGPLRLTGSGAAKPGQVKAAAFISFGVAAAAGLGIVVIISAWWLIAVGAVCILAAWWYTGGKKPYGYLGLGEVMVFLFFGLVATVGTAYALFEVVASRDGIIDFPHVVWVGAVAHGLIASALLMANNVRDIPTDTESGKNTLAVRLGQTRARLAYALMILVPLVLPVALTPISLWYLLPLLVIPLAVGPVRTILHRGNTGPLLIPVLQQTSMVGLAFAAAFSAALLLAVPSLDFAYIAID